MTKPPSEKLLQATPLIAILRGLSPDQAEEMADILVEAGFGIIEVPLNSPEPLKSINIISQKYGDQILVGAGTVLSAADVDDVAMAGGQLIVAPNMNEDVGQASLSADLTWCPGVMTPTEAFAALKLGTETLKLFPCEMIPPQAIKAMRAVLPKNAKLYAVGGINPQNMVIYHAAGASGFGLGSALFTPNMDLMHVKQKATELMTAYHHLLS